MASEISGSKGEVGDEIRLRAYRAQVERANDAHIREVEQEHLASIQRLNEDQEKQLASLRHAYDVKISEEGEALKDRLEKIHEANEQRIAVEKMSGEDE